MKSIYKLLIVLALLGIGVSPKSVYSAGIGVATGFSFQSFYYNGSHQSKENAGFGADVNIFGLFWPHPRVILAPEVGFSYYDNKMWTPYVGLKALAILYPKYSPYLGLILREHFYNTVIEKRNQWVTALYFTLGSHLFSKNNHTLWIMTEFLLVQSHLKTAVSSRFSISLAYTYDFK